MKKILALLLAVVLCAALFVGCNNTTEESSTAPESVGTESVATETNEVTLNVITMFGVGDQHNPVYYDGDADKGFGGIAGFEAEYPYITISDISTTASEEWKTATMADFAANTNIPDVIFYFNGPQAADLLPHVIPVADIQAEYPEYGGELLASAIDAVKEADGASYMLPIKGYWEAVFANETVLKDNGLAIPTTWDELLNIVSVLKAAGIYTFAQGFSDEPHYLIEAMLAAGGGADYGVTPQSPAEVPASWITGLNALKTLADAGAFPANEATLGHGDAVNMVLRGEAAFTVDGSWRCGIIGLSVADADGHFVKTVDYENGEVGPDDETNLSNYFTVFPMPAVPGGNGNGKTITAGFSSGWYITDAAWADADKKDAAVKYVEYMTTAIAVDAFLFGSTPAAAIEVTGLTKVQADGLALVQDSSISYYAPINDRINTAAWGQLWKECINVLNGTKDAKDVLDAAFAIQADPTLAPAE